MCAGWTESIVWLANSDAAPRSLSKLAETPQLSRIHTMDVRSGGADIPEQSHSQALLSATSDENWRPEDMPTSSGNDLVRRCSISMKTCPPAAITRRQERTRVQVVLHVMRSNAKLAATRMFHVFKVQSLGYRMTIAQG